jgi:uncharacterized coiled-coil protein SlyX
MSQTAALTSLRRIIDALDEQRVEVELFRRQMALLRAETAALRESMAAYGERWTPIRRDVDRLTATCRKTESDLATALKGSA